ncbi:MAG TPA: LysE family translocator [Patescibacteria group bacterium]|nr:LysE family translocator [Patescibacteria group bacterium]
MEPGLFLRGLAIGFLLAAPVGPVGILCIRRALSDGRYAAFIAGLGAAFADTFYGAVAGLGLTVVSTFLVSYATALRLVGGVFLLILGGHTYRHKTCELQKPMRGPGMVRDFIATFLITLTNPATILGAMGVFAAVGVLDNRSQAASGTLILGVFGGSTLWWLMLSAGASAVRSRFSPRWLERLNHGSGVVLIVFGVAILGSLIFRTFA